MMAIKTNAYNNNKKFYVKYAQNVIHITQKILIN